MRPVCNEAHTGAMPRVNVDGTQPVGTRRGQRDGVMRVPPGGK